jgi:hypothetical protein
MKKKNDTPVSSTNKIDCHNITEIGAKHPNPNPSTSDSVYTV